MHSPHLQSGVMPHVLEGGVSTWIIWNSARKFVYSPPFIYLSIYLYEYGLMDIYFTLWVIIQYFFLNIFLLKLFQL